VDLRDATLADHSGVCRLWVSACDPCIGASWLERESQARAAHHARRVEARSLEAAVCADHRLTSSISGVPKSGERPASGCARCGLGGRYHLHSPGSSSFVYLAALLDAYSRTCVGWNLSKHIDTQLALGALEKALATRDVRPGLIHHSDRGVKSASTAYVERLHSVQAHISMSAVGNPYDNAKAESFFKTLKQEEVYLKQYQTFEEAEANSGQFIEDVYTTKRLHSSLGYLPPVEFEMAYTQELRY
jgi:transposase InsO family protein